MREPPEDRRRGVMGVRMITLTLVAMIMVMGTVVIDVSRGVAALVAHNAMLASS